MNKWVKEDINKINKKESINNYMNAPENKKAEKSMNQRINESTNQIKNKND